MSSESSSNCAFKAVLFDWKGTLEPKTPKDSRSFQKEDLVEQAKRAIDQQLKEAGYHDDNFSAAHDEIHAEIEQSKTLVSRGVLISKSMDKLKVSQSDPDLARRLQDLYLETIRNPNADRLLFPGAKELLQKLKDNGVPVALIRNSTLPRETFVNNLKEAGVYHLFDTVVMSGDVGHEKPASPIFQRAVSELSLDHLHTKEPHSFIFIGNETEADVKGANAMGWKSCLLTSTEPHSDGHAHYEVSNMEELEQVLFPSTMSPSTNHTTIQIHPSDPNSS
jgi:FMN phosphatase YigB (HAD superfamily)